HSLAFRIGTSHHLATGVSHNDVTRLANDIANSTPGRVTNRTLTKRTSYFDVDWVSYNFDNWNDDLSNEFAQDEQIPADAEAVYDFVYPMNTWKLCVTPTINPNPGTSEGYDQMGTDDAMHGEIYYNTYGGIDSFCNDNHGGAQLPDDYFD
ncbi:YGL262W-like protein, partial [Lipomyces kononenkoae]